MYKKIQKINLLGLERKPLGANRITRFICMIGPILDIFLMIRLIRRTELEQIICIKSQVISIV